MPEARGALVGLASLLALLAPGEPAGAAGPIDCSGVTHGDDLSSLALGRVQGTGRVNFAADPSAKPGCPSAAPACRRPGFLLGGDQIVFDRDVTTGDFTCVSFIGGTGTETDGWLPTARLVATPVTPAWIGRWKRDSSAEIEIAAKPEGKAEVKGTASSGSGAATHVGEIAAVIEASQPIQAFASDGDRQLPFDKAGQYDCAVRMKTLGPYLFVDDNNNCGGANVSFSGLYRKR